MTASPPVAPAAGPAAWDSALSVWPRAHLLQSWGWGDVQAEVGWTPHRLVVRPPGRPALPVLVLESRSARLVSPRLYIPKGPACDPGDTDVWEAVLRRLARLARHLRAASVAIEPPAWSQEIDELRKVLGSEWVAEAARQPGATAVVDLLGGADTVLSRMRPKGRYNTRLAERRGVTAEMVADPAQASDILGRLCAATAARQGIVQPDAGHIRLCLDRLRGSSVWVATVEGEPVSAALVAPFGGEVVYLYGGSVDRHRDRQPSALLHWAVIRSAVDAGLERYDLWGIPPDADPGHAWHGLRQFKLALGGVELHTAGVFRRVERPLADTIDGRLQAARLWLRRARHPALRRPGPLRRRPRT